MAAVTWLRRPPALRTQLALALLGVLALAFALRAYRIDSTPAGLHPDEAAEGLDALKILAGARPVYLPDNHGREPLFAYLVAASITLLGRTPGAIRLVGVLADVAGVLGAYLALAALFNRRVGLAASLFYAITVWPILTSRFGTRPPLLPPLLAFCLWQGALAWKTGRTRHWLLAGALLGLALYSYTPVRVFPLFLLLALAVAAARRQWSRLWPGAAWAAALCALVALPFGLYALAHWEVVFGRSAEASILKPGATVGTVASQTYQVARMFVFSGDWNPRQDVWTPGNPAPPRPVFDWAAGLAFGLGNLVALRRWRRPAVWLAYAWLGVMLLPTILSDEAPHFGRAVGALPVAFLWPALGTVALRDRLGQWLGRWPALLAASALVGLSFLATVRDLVLADYWGQPWLSSVYYGGPATAVAVETDRFLGEGWTGANLKAISSSASGRNVVVDESLTHSGAWAFLVGPDQPSVSILAEGASLPQPIEARTLLLLPAGDSLPEIAGPPGQEVRMCRGGWAWSPPGNERGAAYYVAYAIATPENDLKCY
jgi:Dolichyl-phosphate-mannose-protein mannosyltransferase